MSPPVVDLREVEPGIVQLTMQDRLYKNTFSAELVGAIAVAFATVRGNPRWRVLILTGYDNYFCSGGTQSALLDLHAGKAVFADMNIYSLPLECEIPVIAAMQGHGIGGGLVFGLFADHVIASRESLYTANFMRYGFTPGMGATCVLPAKLGMLLAQEMLLSARGYRGEELERRGAPFAVVKRAEVAGRALELAREIAQKPRAALVLLKSHLVAEMRAQLPRFIEKELAMHAATIHEPEVSERIRSEFGKLSSQ